MNKTTAMRALLYSGDLLAVDLGTFAVKVLHLKAKERSLTVLGSGSREVWRELSEAKTEEEKTGIYAAALRELLSAHGFKTRNASISLAGNVVILRFLELHEGFKLDPLTGLPPEAKALIPFDEADAVVSSLLQDAGKDGHPPHAEMMLAVAQKKTVLGGMDIVRKAGLRPAVIINDVLALANAYEFFEGERANETIVLVNAGATSTSVSVLENGAVKAARIFNIAGNSFTRAVKREFSVELEEAETLKIAHGLFAPKGKAGVEDSVATRVAGALKPVVKDLSVEIQRTIDVFHERRPADYPPILRIVLAGGSAALPGLPELLASDTGMSVSVFRPMVNTVAKTGAIGIAPLAPGLAVSCGLALSNTLVRRSHEPRVNLVPRRERRSAIIRDVSPGFWRMIVGPAVAAVVLCVYGVWAVRVSRREAAHEQRLEASAREAKALWLKFKKTKAVAPKRTSNPYVFLSQLTISGVFSDNRNALVMLNGDGAVFVVRNGKLYDSNEDEVKGVTSSVSGHALTLSGGGHNYSIQLPK
jgi:type IV pilus assembly protein PilM